jgi:CheY-like chemotaxis protein
MWDMCAIVDDNKFDRLICNRIVERLDESIDVVQFDSGESILSYLVSDDFLSDDFLIFLDINMPKMNGFEFLEQMVNSEAIKPKLHTISVIIMTSSTRIEDRDMAAKYPCVRGFIQKPMQASQVESAMRVN